MSNYLTPFTYWILVIYSLRSTNKVRRNSRSGQFTDLSYGNLHKHDSTVGFSSTRSVCANQMWIKILFLSSHVVRRTLLMMYDNNNQSLSVVKTNTFNWFGKQLPRQWHCSPSTVIALLFLINTAATQRDFTHVVLCRVLPKMLSDTDNKNRSLSKVRTWKTFLI